MAGEASASAARFFRPPSAPLDRELGRIQLDLYLTVHEYRSNYLSLSVGVLTMIDLRPAEFLANGHNKLERHERCFPEYLKNEEAICTRD